MSQPLDRAQFPVTQKFNYLNHAAVGVLPLRTRDAVTQFVASHSEQGVLGVWPYEAKMPEYRAAVARYINAGPSEIAILRNTGDGANVLALGLDWEPGDEIILSDNEFPSNVYPWLNCRRFGVNVLHIQTDRERMTADVLRKHITERTRVVAVSWVSFADGYRHDLAALAEVAHDAGALLCVDAIQGLGAFRLDVSQTGVDAVYAGGAKWLMSLQGVSFLFVRESLLDRLQLAMPGWRSAADMWNTLNYAQPPVGDATRFEGGTPNFVGALSMAESIQLLSTPGIEQHVLSLSDRLAEGLQRIGARLRAPREDGTTSGIVTFTLAGCDNVALGKALAEERIVTTYRSNGVRVSPHGYNTAEEIDHLLEVTAQLGARLQSV